MSRLKKYILSAIGAAVLMYAMGFFFIPPLIKNTTTGTVHYQLVFKPLSGAQRIFYSPLLNKLGAESFITKIWYRNAIWWGLEDISEVPNH